MHLTQQQEDTAQGTVGFCYLQANRQRFPIFAVDLSATLYLGSLQMTSLLHHRHHHHHHTAIVSAEARGSR
jgi:hypothetical protein